MRQLPRGMYRSWPNRETGSQPLGKHWGARYILKVLKYHIQAFNFDYLVGSTCTGSNTFSCQRCPAKKAGQCHLYQHQHHYCPSARSCEPVDKQWPTPRTLWLAASMSPPKTPDHDDDDDHHHAHHIIIITNMTILLVNITF